MQVFVFELKIITRTDLFLLGVFRNFFMEINDIFLWSETMEMAECVRVAKFVPNV